LAIFSMVNAILVGFLFSINIIYNFVNSNVCKLFN
jgi:hypothetical protein